MRALLTLVFAILESGIVMGGPLVEPAPSDRFSAARFELEYLRPWGTLDIHEGRVAIGLPVAAPFWAGLSVGALSAPTVEELRFGLWVRGGNWLRAEYSRRKLQVQTLESADALAAELDLRMVSGPWSLGWSGEFTDSGGARIRPVVRRFFWAGYRGTAAEIAIGRRVQPWTGSVRWESSIVLRVGAGLRLALRWREAESVFALQWGAAAMAVVVSSVWTGPRAGSFGFRVAERR